MLIQSEISCILIGEISQPLPHSNVLFPKDLFSISFNISYNFITLSRDHSVPSTVPGRPQSPHHTHWVSPVTSGSLSEPSLTNHHLFSRVLWKTWLNSLLIVVHSVRYIFY